MILMIVTCHQDNTRCEAMFIDLRTWNYKDLI